MLPRTSQEDTWISVSRLPAKGVTKADMARALTVKYVATVGCQLPRKPKKKETIGFCQTSPAKVVE